ncbi:hypothetical protein HDU83_005099 [Entophlyctis luteolus]|nr:hypothetical protein HDU83_005099 [Entophlyctis luteolus]
MIVALFCFSDSVAAQDFSLNAWSSVPQELLAVASVMCIADADSFKAVEWLCAGLHLPPSKLSVRNVGSCMPGASAQRTVEAMLETIHLATEGQSNGFIAVPASLARDVPWNSVVETLRKARTDPDVPVDAVEGQSRLPGAFYFPRNAAEFLLGSLSLVASTSGHGSDADTWQLIREFVQEKFVVETLSSTNTLVPGAKDNDGSSSSDPIVAIVGARIGLMGNPSDGFFGQTISLLIRNFSATVTLIPNASAKDPTITFIQSPILDPIHFPSLEGLSQSCANDGYYGVQRLLLAAANVFAKHVDGIVPVPQKNGRGFSVTYATNIPRQVGLAGSSALITAFLRALARHHNLTAHPSFAPHILANVALAAERDELGIAAGLQDRVIQSHGGLVHMDFNKTHMDTHGFGIYTRLPLSNVPPRLWIAYVGAPSDSGAIHSDVRARFLRGDPAVVTAMNEFAQFASRARESILARDWGQLARLMDANFDLRRATYGDEVVGAANILVVDTARAFGHAAKFSGSGGCVVGLWRGGEDAGSVYAPEDPARRLELKRRIRALGYVFEDVVAGDECDS